MTKEDKQIIDRGIKENWRIGDRTRLKHLLEKNFKLYRENIELEKENEEMKKGLGCETCQIHLEYEKLNTKIAELEQQIEKYIEGNKKLQKVIYEDTIYIGKLREQIEKMKADVKQEQSYWNSGEMQYGLFQRLLDKWEIKE